jgi:hypothetical protein
MRKHYMIDGMGKSCKMCVEFSWRGNSHGFAIRYALNIKHRQQSGKENRKRKVTKKVRVNYSLVPIS